MVAMVVVLAMVNGHAAKSKEDDGHASKKRSGGKEDDAHGKEDDGHAAKRMLDTRERQRG